MARNKGPESADVAIAMLASRQYGVVTRRQLLDAGVSGIAIDGRIGTLLHAVHVAFDAGYVADTCAAAVARAGVGDIRVPGARR